MQSVRKDLEGPSFAVVTATYNRADLLPRCIESVMSQTYQNFQLLVVDDGSTDNTADIVASFARQDSRVRYLRQDHLGANAARNLGAERSTADYILVLDSDDEVRPRWLHELADLIGGTAPAVVGCGIEFVANGRLLDTVVPKSDSDAVFLSGTYAVKRCVFKAIGGFAAALPAHQSTEFRIRLDAYCQENDLVFRSSQAVLVRAHSHSGPKIRRDANAKLEATEYIIRIHRSKLGTRRTLASWWAAAGGCAIELERYGDARRFFFRAVISDPAFWKNYARIAAVSVPFLRTRYRRRMLGGG